MSKTTRAVVVPERIETHIFLVRGQKAMLSTHLAELYGVEPRVLVQAVKRNAERFPEDFMFQLSAGEFDNLKSQIVISSWGGFRRAAPYAFTEQGVAMLATVLRSPRAVQVNIEIMRAFVRLRQMLQQNADLARKLATMEKKYDTQFKVVFDAIRGLMAPPEPRRKRIGFRSTHSLGPGNAQSACKGGESMKKIDLKKELKSLYQPSAKAVALVEVPTMNYLMIDGEGDPNTAKSYAEAIETLFAVAYTVKFSIKKSQEIDYGVMPLESLWWADDMTAFTTGDKSNWKWTAMIMQPSFVTAKVVADAVADVKRKKNPAALAKLRFESLSEGTCAQTLHVGPFSEEGPTIARVHEFIRARGAKLAGKHHEIYLSDLRKAAPEKWKTVVRQPLALKGN